MRCSIVPPHILQHVADRHGDEQVRELVRRSLDIDNEQRSARLIAQLIQPGATTPAQPHRTLYTADHREQLPGTVLRSEGAPPAGDIDADRVYDWLGITFDFYLTVFGRNSIDGAGLPLTATVHYYVDYDNAFWNGEQMVYGDGDQRLFATFTAPLDVTGHELTHGVTQYTANLEYRGQSGALNESVSDAFGSLVKQFHRRETADQADWLIGQGVFTAQVEGTALRSMKNPGTAYNDDVLGKDPQPATMTDYVETDQDNGGVHINSGIPNRAFALLSIDLGGFAWERAGKIWYDTLTGGTLDPRADFAVFAAATLETATKLYGAASPESDSVRRAWAEVGIKT